MCASLRPYLPKVSVRDTEKTLDNILVFYDVFEEVCS